MCCIVLKLNITPKPAAALFKGRCTKYSAEYQLPKEANPHEVGEDGLWPSSLLRDL
jgi:hypothetical protein